MHSLKKRKLANIMETALRKLAVDAQCYWNFVSFFELNENEHFKETKKKNRVRRGTRALKWNNVRRLLRN